MLVNFAIFYEEHKIFSDMHELMKINVQALMLICTVASILSYVIKKYIIYSKAELKSVSGWSDDTQSSLQAHVPRVNK